MLLADRHRRSVGIALTPLVDVVFILLLFFMLTSTFKQLQHLAVASATDGQADPADAPPRVQLLVIDAQHLLVDGQAMRRDDVEFDNAVRDWIVDSRTVAAGGRQGATVQDLVTLLDRLRSEGLVSVSVFESVPPP